MGFLTHGLLEIEQSSQSVRRKSLKESSRVCDRRDPGLLVSLSLPSPFQFPHLFPDKYFAALLWT